VVWRVEATGGGEGGQNSRRRGATADGGRTGSGDGEAAASTEGRRASRRSTCGWIGVIFCGGGGLDGATPAALPAGIDAARRDMAGGGGTGCTPALSLFPGCCCCCSPAPAWLGSASAQELEETERAPQDQDATVARAGGGGAIWWAGGTDGWPGGGACGAWEPSLTGERRAVDGGIGVKARAGGDRGHGVKSRDW
jgi:hypothetical protein